MGTSVDAGRDGRRKSEHSGDFGRRRVRRTPEVRALWGLRSTPGSTDAGSPSTVGTSVDAGESPLAAAERRRQLRRMSRASSVSVTCDASSGDSGTAASAVDSTLQLRFRSLVRRHGSSVRLAAGLFMSSLRRQSTGFSCDGDSVEPSSLKSVQTERKDHQSTTIEMMMMMITLHDKIPKTSTQKYNSFMLRRRT